MGRKIPINQLSAAVMEQLTEYAELATEDVKEAVKKAGTTVRKDIEASAPRDTGDYAKLTPCTNCIPVKRRAEIDKINQERIELGELLKNPVYTGGATTGGGTQASDSASDSSQASDGVTITIR